MTLCKQPEKGWHDLLKVSYAQAVSDSGHTLAVLIDRPDKACLSYHLQDVHCPPRQLGATHGN